MDYFVEGNVVDVVNKKIFEGKVYVKNGNGTIVALQLSNGTTGDFVITGAGAGHGVGMSQRGAMGMASAGFTYEDILKHYFIGVQIEKANFY